MRAQLTSASVGPSEGAKAKLRWKNVALASLQEHAASRGILLWVTPSEAPKALQAPERSELLEPVREKLLGLRPALAR